MPNARQPEPVEPVIVTLVTVVYRMLRAATLALRDELERIDAEYTAQQIRAGKFS